MTNVTLVPKSTAIMSSMLPISRVTSLSVVVNMLFVSYLLLAALPTGGIFPHFLEIWGISNPMGNGEFPGELH